MGLLWWAVRKSIKSRPGITLVGVNLMVGLVRNFGLEGLRAGLETISQGPNKFSGFFEEVSSDLDAGWWADVVSILSAPGWNTPLYGHTSSLWPTLPQLTQIECNPSYSIFCQRFPIFTLDTRGLSSPISTHNRANLPRAARAVFVSIFRGLPKKAPNLNRRSSSKYSMGSSGRRTQTGILEIVSIEGRNSGDQHLTVR